MLRCGGSLVRLLGFWCHVEVREGLNDGCDNVVFVGGRGADSLVMDNRDVNEVSIIFTVQRQVIAVSVAYSLLLLRCVLVGGQFLGLEVGRGALKIDASAR